MAIENTPLQNEIENILMENGATPVHARWSCKIITPRTAHTPIKFLSLDIERDYLNNFSDHTVLEVVLSGGVYAHEILPYKQELQVEIVRFPEGEGNGDPSAMEVTVKTFRAILHTESDDAISASDAQSQTQAAKDLSELMNVEFQLMPMALEQIRLREVGGIYRNTVPGEVVRYNLNYVSDSLELDFEDAITGVDVVPFDNTEPHPNLIIPQGTKVQDLAAWVQDDGGGVYNTGIGCYLQDNHWYVWPEFNTRRFEETAQVLQIVNLPPKRYRGVERTWRLDGRQVFILSTGEVAHLDLSHHNRLNSGNAARHTHGDPMLANPNSFGKNFGQSTKDGKFVIGRGDNNSEYVGSKRPNYDVAPVSDARITNNAFAEASRLSKRLGAYITLTWEHSSPDHIYPGMPVRLMYLKEDEIQEVDGVVVKAHHYIHNPTPGPIAGRHISNTALTMFINPVEES